MSATFRRLEGTVGSLSISPGEQQFLHDQERLASAAVGAGLAASGLAGAGIAAAAASTTPGDSVEYFSCRIGDAFVTGAFSKVTFKDGESVVAVVEHLQSMGWLARAIVRPRDSMVWIEPHCSRGTSAHLVHSLLVGLWVVLGFVAVSLPLLWGLSGDDAKSAALRSGIEVPDEAGALPPAWSLRQRRAGQARPLAAGVYTPAQKKVEILVGESKDEWDLIFDHAALDKADHPDQN